MIPISQRNEIFERFYQCNQARNDDDHYGLGLAIAKMIVDNHKGKIKVNCLDEKIIFDVLIPTK